MRLIIPRRLFPIIIAVILVLFAHSSHSEDVLDAKPFPLVEKALPDSTTQLNGIYFLLQKDTIKSNTCTVFADSSNYIDVINSLTQDDILCLQDGTYTNGLTVPSGVTVKAINVGGPEFIGGDAAWGAILLMSGNGSTVDGLKIHKPNNSTSNACEVDGTNNTLKNTSCSHGGAHKHKIPLRVSGSGHLIEDSWFYGVGRYVVQCFVGDHNTFRRNVARWDSTAPNEADEPNAAFSIYNCSNITIENNISLDYGVPETTMQFGGDFYSPNNLSKYPQGNHDNHWLGNIVVNHSAATNNNRAFRADHDGPITTVISGGIIKDFYMKDSKYDFIIKSDYQFEISNCTRINVTNETSSIPCTGADITVRYKNGVKTSESLFPFAHEALIKSDMCASGERQSDWCQTDYSLSEYIAL